MAITHPLLQMLNRYKASLAYMLVILLLNKAFTMIPLFYVAGELLSPLDFFVGAILVFRDFAQREIGHRVIVPMIIAGVLSYLMADVTVAYASMIALFVSELIEWGIYTYTKKPLSQRILRSAVLSSPVDSFIFLYLMGRVNSLAFAVMTLTKILGVMIVILTWKRLNRRDAEAVAA